MARKLKLLGAILGALILISFFGRSFLPDFFTVSRPEIKLPAEAIGHLGPIPVTNSMLAAWITAAFLIIVSLLATRRMKLVPKGIQNIFETVLELLFNLSQDVAGKENGRRFFPLVTTIFLFVIFNAWISLIPGFGTIYLKEGEGHVELLRGANTDLNVPLALAIMSFVFVEYWGIASQGFLRYMSKFFNFGRLLHGLKELFTGKIKVAMWDLFNGVISVFVGIIELLSELIRLLSFTFRLFGNMTAGEILLLVMIFLVSWILPTLFYALEAFVGLVQALIFALLTLVFGSMAVTPPHGEHE